MGWLELDGVTHWSIPVNDLEEEAFYRDYFLDPSGNMLELRDPSWRPGMPTPTLEELAGA